jgi:hypothetical protein
VEAIVWNMHHNQVKWARFLRHRSELAADVHLPCEGSVATSRHPGDWPAEMFPAQDGRPLVSY